MTQHNQALRHLRVVFLLWFVLLTVATHLPQATPSDNAVLDMPDKLFHFVFFGALAFFFICSNWVRPIFFSWLIMALWTFLDEYTQDLLPINRPFSFGDLLAGELGVFAAYCWKGALHLPQLNEVRNRTESVLASTKNWIFLAGITVFVLFLTTGSLWYLSNLLTGTQYSEFAFLVGTVAAVVVGVLTIKRMGTIQHAINVGKINLVLQVFGTIGIAVVVGVAVRHTFLDPWVIAFYIIVLCSRFIWDKTIQTTA